MKENKHFPPLPLDNRGQTIFPELSPESLAEFKKIAEEEAGEPLTDAEAKNAATRLFQIWYMLEIYPGRAAFAAGLKETRKGTIPQPPPKRRRKRVKLGRYPRGTDLSPEAATRRRRIRLMMSRRRASAAV